MSLSLCKIENALDGVLISVLMTACPVVDHAYLADWYVDVEVASEVFPVGVVSTEHGPTFQ